MSPTRGLPGPDAEWSSVRFGKTTIPYFIRRSQNRKTVSIAVHPGFGVVVTAPTGGSRERLDAVVHGKARWIVEKVRRERDVQPGIPKREFVDGETFLYLGRQYRLKVQSGTKTVRTGLYRGRLVVALRKARKGSLGAAKAVRKDLVGWYGQKAAEQLPERVEHWAATLGVAAPRVLIRQQTQRWASNDRKGTIRFNWRIVQAPMRLVDYVVAHELVHSEIKKHSTAFWARLGEVLPDYDLRREQLRRLGKRLEW
jgi:predicted metal-dependent hydrolase